MSEFKINGNRFEFDGKPMQVISGAIHYFRTVPEYWDDRLKKLKACGFNTVETYIPWNLHEPKEGKYYFEGIADIERFLETAKKYDLKVIVRPSQYICAEWEFGGLPSWLLKDRNISLRCADKKYLEKVDNYFKVLIPKLAKHQCTVGGPIIMCQIENEYGSYGNDKEYLSFLEGKMREYGMNILLFTSDGSNHYYLHGGTLPHVFKTANFGSRPKEQFENLKTFPTFFGPIMCTEYWNGWFDHWGEEHHVREPEEAVACFKEMLDMGASVNFYMFHGGTNFGFMNGANCPGKKDYQPTITSYDYCAPLTEEGNTTKKYDLLRELLKDYREDEDNYDIVPVAPSVAYGRVRLTQSAPLRLSADLLAEKQTSRAILPMEQYGQMSGSILYRTHVAGPNPSTKLELWDVHDRAHVFVNGKRIATVYRNDTYYVVENVCFPEEDNVLDIIVENLGRINFGPYLHDEKGITDAVCIYPPHQHLFGWEVWPLEMDDLSKLVYDEGDPCELPAFFRGTLTVTDKPKDTYIRLTGFEHGSVWINGFNLGRFWNSKGPQRTLYLPAPLLKEGDNEIVVLEYDAVTEPVVDFEDKNDIG
ncbi:MAG: beta-galactosidase [Clostridia bacterium]|nr:beta-galactosidase [Clostridia bacterium]